MEHGVKQVAKRTCGLIKVLVYKRTAAVSDLRVVVPTLRVPICVPDTPVAGIGLVQIQKIDPPYFTIK